MVEYAERMVDPVPVSTDETAEPSRIEEGCRLVVAPLIDLRGVAPPSQMP